MARCGCGTTCSCVVQAGLRTTVTGNGSTANPYAISADVQGSTTVTDTSTVDSVITGTGAAATPWIISANVKISASPDNCLSANPDGLFIQCPDGSDTIVQDGTLTSVSGTGTISDPYIVNADVQGNTTVLDTVTVNASVTGAGTAGNPWVISANVIPACGLVSTPAGLAVNVSAWPFACDEDNGTGIYCDPDNGVLRGDPPHTSVSGRITGIEVVTVDLDTAGTVELIDTVLVNPSTCRSMVFTFTVETGWSYDISPGTTAIFTSSNNVHGSGVSFANDFNGPGDQAFTRNETDGGTILVAPGASFNFIAEATIDAPAYTDGSVFVRSAALNFFGSTV